METLKGCLQPKDQKPENRPNCEQFLHKINEFSVDKSLLTEDKNNYEDFISFLGEQENSFLKKFFEFKTNDKMFKILFQIDSIKSKINNIIMINDSKLLLSALLTLLQLTAGSSKNCEIFISNHG